MATVLLSRAQVLERLGHKSTSWLYQVMAEGKFPRPVRLSPCSVAWVQSEVDDFITRRISENRVVLTAKPRTRKPKTDTSAAPDQGARVA